MYIQAIFEEWINVLDNQDEILDDLERYVKIAMKLEPNDPACLLRNENDEQKYVRYFTSIYIFVNNLFHPQ